MCLITSRLVLSRPSILPLSDNLELLLLTTMLNLWWPFLISSWFLLLGSAAPEMHGAYDYGHDMDLTIHKRDVNPNKSKSALVESIPYNGTIPIRPELRGLQNNFEQWNLYILAVSWMQWMNQSDPASWYAIAGS